MMVTITIDETKNDVRSIKNKNELFRVNTFKGVSFTTIF